MTDLKVPGDRILATDWNSMVRAADQIGSITGNGLKVTSGPSGISLNARVEDTPFAEPAISVPIFNNSGVDFLIYQPVAITGQVASGTKAEYQRILKAVVPADGYDGKFAVCMQPIKAGRIGRAYIMGVCLVRLQNPNSDALAEIVSGQNYLAGSSSGGAQILDYNAGLQLGIIRFPFGSGGALGMARARVASTANVALTGTFVHDGIALAAGDKFLARHQTNPAENGLWKVAAGAWTKIGQPELVQVILGTVNGGYQFNLSAANTYSQTIVKAFYA